MPLCWDKEAMIAVTSNSLLHNSTLPALPNSVPCSFLEDETGADFLLSIAPYPCRTPALLQKHIDAGAVLIQHKSTLDLLNSLGERLDDASARMVECTLNKRTYQRVLLSTGLYTWTLRDGKKYVVLNGVTTDTLWNSYRGAVGKWEGRGGRYVNLVSDADIPEWCEMTLRHMQEFSQYPVKHVYKTARMPETIDADLFQFPISVKDARNVLINIPGVGPTMAEWMWRITDGNLAHCLTLLTHPDAATLYDDKPRNLGSALIAKCREYFGLTRPTDYITQIEYDTIGEKNGS